MADELHKAKYVVLICPNLLVVTDHKSLLGLFVISFVDIQNPRLLYLAEKTLWFKFKVVYVPGWLNNGSEYMSRKEPHH